jgi:hypothetical protein
MFSCMDTGVAKWFFLSIPVESKNIKNDVPSLALPFFSEILFFHLTKIEISLLPLSVNDPLRRCHKLVWSACATCRHPFSMSKTRMMQRSSIALFTDSQRLFVFLQLAFDCPYHRILLLFPSFFLSRRKQIIFRYCIPPPRKK